MRWLVALYPRRWRERYEEEYTELLSMLAEDNRSRYGRLRLALDIVRGVLDARFRWRLQTMLSRYAAVRRGLLDGAYVAVTIATILVLSNVVFPAGPNESDDDPEYLVQIIAGYAAMLFLLALIGARARRRSDSEWAGVLGGATAGLVIAAAMLVTTLAIDNLFLSIVSQQHDKRIAFAASGWTSMRAYLTVRTLIGAVFLLPALATIGGLLGALGGALSRRHPRPMDQRH
jgi:hypothetical protein